MDYAPATWGYTKYSKWESIQNRAMRTLLGVGNMTPVVALYGNLYWTHPYMKTQARSCQILADTLQNV